MKRNYAWQYSISSGGGLIERELNKFLGPERGVYWRGGLFKRGLNREFAANNFMVFMHQFRIFG